MIHNQARAVNVVLDVGSFHTFAGQSGFQNPRFASNSYLVEYHQKKDKYAAGKQALDSESTHKQIHNVFENAAIDGKVDKFHFNIDKFDKFVETILMDNLELDNCSISLLIAEDMSVELDASQVLKQRQKIVDYLLEGMELTNIAFLRKPVLSTFALGRTSSTVLDSGHSFSHCSIVEDGYCVFNKTVRLGGSLINNSIRQQIEQKSSGRPYKSLRELSEDPYREGDIAFHRIVELSNISNKFSYVPIKASSSLDSQINFTLPDGHNIKLNRSQIIDPFVNFHKFYKKYQKNNWLDLPSYIDNDFYKIIGNYSGLPNFLTTTIQQYFNILQIKNHTVVASSDLSKKKFNQLSMQDLLNNVILTGGNLCFNDLGWSIANNVRAKGGRVLQGPIQFNKDIDGYQCQNFNSLSWIGGSIVSNLDTFSHFWIKSSQWRELGSHLVSVKSMSGVNSAEYEQNIRTGKKLQLVSKKCA